MNGLNTLQKKELDRYAGVFSCDEIPPQVLERIKSINDHETFYQNADRYLSDLYFEKMINTPSSRFI